MAISFRLRDDIRGLKQKLIVLILMQKDYGCSSFKSFFRSS